MVASFMLTACASGAPEAGYDESAIKPASVGRFREIRIGMTTAEFHAFLGQSSAFGLRGWGFRAKDGLTLQQGADRSAVVLTNW